MLSLILWKRVTFGGEDFNKLFGFTQGLSINLDRQR